MLSFTQNVFVAAHLLSKMLVSWLAVVTARNVMSVFRHTTPGVRLHYRVSCLGLHPIESGDVHAHRQIFIAGVVDSSRAGRLLCWVGEQ